MRRKTHLISILVLGCVLSLAFSLQAEDKDKDYELNGYFKFGYRFVDTSGAETRYMQDINLEKGVRLFFLLLTRSIQYFSLHLCRGSHG